MLLFAHRIIKGDHKMKPEEFTCVKMKHLTNPKPVHKKEPLRVVTIIKVLSAVLAVIVFYEVMK